MPEHFDEDQPIYRESSPLLVVRTRLTPDIDDEGYPPPETATPENDPGLPVLFNRPLKSAFDDPLGSFDRAMSEPAESGQVNGESAVTAHNAKQSQPTNGDLKSLEATAAAAVQESDRDATLLGDPEDHASRTKRIDSAQDHEEEVSVPPTDQPSKSITEQPTSKVHPDPSPTKDASVPIQRDSIANSPTLSKHMHLPDQNAGHTLPAVKTVSPVKDSIAMSPQAPVLPSIKHLTDHLTGLAEAAMQHDTRATPSHSHSITSTMAPSPIQPMQPQYFPPNFHHPSSHTSPSGYHSGYSARSPTSTVGGDMSHYSSPHAPTTGATYFPDRRRSTSLNGKPPPFLSAMTPSMPSMPSTASSNENFSHPNSSTDGGYSTSHTTPIAADGSGEGLPRPLLPPPHGMNLPPIEGYRCEYPGCNAAPFQTQYLLTSHRNVHSQVRSHYCPVKGCPRSEGGKGFKRKNEMIRHGLVHSSPGYICPFCPDREHRYPRPDNLQRHVRVHHEDKDKDDPVLREVLAQRLEGDGKQRRRRTQGSVSSVNNDTAA